ncbi:MULTISPECIES: hypothetical protein [unclassified Bradyrhizobium]|uniref:hypothetical protein n=1 Tax=unclassified Bradyrhizobium TaxID=2631580 RepID=UPI000423A997|nr:MULTISPECIES: hypothetical protein [unclassified Bradyrhizobium]MDA9491396.1 hypothetical protein [Bradyrhizobium sp. CCBAU 11361]
MKKPVKYIDEPDPAWSVAAVEKFEVTPHPDAHDPMMLQLDGHCPRCEDHMQHTEFLIAFKGVAPTSPDTLRAAVEALRDKGLIGESLLPAEFSVRCNCKVKHPDPLGRAALTGCGATWKMRIESFGEEHS